MIQPQRTIRDLGDGKFELLVEPPAWTGFKSSKLILTEQQKKKLIGWLEHGGLIQEIFPELSSSDREIIVSGVNPKEWDAHINDSR